MENQSDLIATPPHVGTRTIGKKLCLINQKGAESVALRRDQPTHLGASLQKGITA